jgi:hypothetical protein
MISDQAKPLPADGYRVEEIDGELLLYHPQSTATVYMNNTAALVWQLCDGNREVAEIVEILVESFPDTEGDLRSDVLRALDSFHQQGALKLQ